MGCVNEFMQLAGTRVGTAGAAGAVNVMYGSAGVLVGCVNEFMQLAGQYTRCRGGQRAARVSRGLTVVGGQVFTQDSPGVPGRAQEFDVFGFTLATGDPGPAATPAAAASASGPSSRTRRTAPGG